MPDSSSEAHIRLPMIERVRELRTITGASANCGWMCDEQAFLLYALVKWCKPALIIQTGHLWGKSALILAEALDDGMLMGGQSIETTVQDAHAAFSAFLRNNAPTPMPGRVISIDPKPRNVPHYQKGVEYIQSKHPSFQFFEMTSDAFFDRLSDYVPELPPADRIMGIVDGDHSYMGCLKDLRNFAKMGAHVIIVDDTSWIPFIGRVCRRFARRNGYSYLPLANFNGLGILVRKRALSPNLQTAQNSTDSRIAEFADAIGGYFLATAMVSLWSFVITLPRRMRRLAARVLKS